MSVAEADAYAEGLHYVGSASVLRALARLPGYELARGADVFERLRSSRRNLRLPPVDEPAVRSTADRVGGVEGCNPEVLHALVQAWRYAIRLQQMPPGPVHILLGLLWDKSSEAAQIAATIDLTFERAFAEISDLPRPPHG